jgi:hypothetical protein
MAADVASAQSAGGSIFFQKLLERTAIVLSGLIALGELLENLRKALKNSVPGVFLSKEICDLVHFGHPTSRLWKHVRHRSLKALKQVRHGETHFFDQCIGAASA